MTDRDTWNMFAAHAPISLLDAMEAAGMGNDVRYALQRQEIDGNRHLFDAHAELCANWADALLAASKSRTFEDEKGGWIAHDGRGCPYAPDTLIDLEFGRVLPASHINWQITFRYRLASEADGEKA